MHKLLILIIFLISTSTAIAYDFVLADIASPKSSNIDLDSSDLETNNVGGNFESISGLPDIKRTIEPNYKDFTIKNKSIKIIVKIPGFGRSLDDILIKEIADNNFDQVSNLHIYIENPIFSNRREIYPSKSNVTNNIRNMLEMLHENYSIVSNTIYIKIPRLNLGEDIVYNYTVKSNKSGIFCVDTLFRLNGSKWPDSIRQDTIEVRPPEIEVDILEDQLFAIRGEPLDIILRILHKSGWCNDPISISGYFNQSDKYDIWILKKDGKDYEKYDGRIIELNLTPLEPTSYPMRIYYHNAGKHHIPSLNVIGATVKQEDFDIEVMPDDNIKALMDYAPYLSLLGLILAAIGIFYQQKEINDIRIKIDNIKYQPLYFNIENKANPKREQTDDEYLIYEDLKSETNNGSRDEG